MMREKKEEIAKREGLEKASDEYILRLIYYELGDSDFCVKTVGDVTKKLKAIKLQKDKYKFLKDNILIRSKGYGWKSWESKWSGGGKKFTVA